jgi:1,4-alpha-glucan branching enzyme
MLKFSRRYRVLSKPVAQSLWIDQEKKIIAFYRGDMVYLVNLHPTDSYPDFFLPVGALGPGSYRAVFSTDDVLFGGEGRVDEEYRYLTRDSTDRGTGFFVYAPCRTMMALRKED